MKGWKGNKTPVNVSFSEVITGAFFVAGNFSSAIIFLEMTKTCQTKYFFTSFSANIWAMSEKNLPIKTVLFVNQKIIWKFVDLHFYVKINIWIDRKQLMEFWKKKTIIYLSFYLMSFFYIELEIFWWCLIIQNAYSELSFSNLFQRGVWLRLSTHSPFNKVLTKGEIGGFEFSFHRWLSSHLLKRTSGTGH